MNKFTTAKLSREVKTEITLLFLSSGITGAKKKKSRGAAETQQPKKKKEIDCSTPFRQKEIQYPVSICVVRGKKKKEK